MIVTSHLMGGLGNQMFQIAKAKTEGLQNNIEVVFRPSSFIPMEGNQPTKYFNNILRNVKFKNITEQLTRISEPSWSYSQIDPLYYTSIEYYGYFQSSKNFRNFVNEIKNLFQPTDEFIHKIKNLYPFVFGKNSISIHVRRGDYTTVSDVLPVIDKSYIDKSLSLIKDKGPIFIFSNDKDWVIKNLNYPNSIVVDGLEDYEDLWMMSLCNHNIMSNSSFSWWGSYLNKNIDKQVYVPSIWFGPRGEKKYQDIYETNWIKINVKYKNGFLMYEEN